MRAIWQSIDVQGARLPGFWGHTLALNQGKVLYTECVTLPPSTPSVTETLYPVTDSVRKCAGKLYLIGGIATPGESRAQAGEEVITLDTSVWNCARRITSGAGPEFTDSHAAVTAGTCAVHTCQHATLQPGNFSNLTCRPMQVSGCTHLEAQMVGTSSMRCVL